MRPLRIEFPGAVYHACSRGVERRPIFRDDADRNEFLVTLGRSMERWRWACHAYCLMGNHYHLVIETPEPNLSRGMRQLNGEYSQAFNRHHERSGHLFQGRFHAVLVEKETHLLEVCRYVVLNPVRARMVRGAGDWPWSSYAATAGKAEVPAFLKTDWVLDRFSLSRAAAHSAYECFVGEERGGVKSLAVEIRHGLWVGSEGYLEKIREHIEGCASVPEFRLTERMAHRPPLREYLAPEKIGNRDSLVSAVGLAYLDGRYTQREIAEFLGMHYMSVSRLIRAYEKRAE